jgi:hypothetical protein
LARDERQFYDSLQTVAGSIIPVTVSLSIPGSYNRVIHAFFRSPNSMNVLHFQS